jgi:hypothetical protein
VSYYAAVVEVLDIRPKGRWFGGLVTTVIEETRWLIDDDTDPTTRHELEDRCDRWEQQGFTVRTHWRELRHYELDHLRTIGWDKE